MRHGEVTVSNTSPLLNLALIGILLRAARNGRLDLHTELDRVSEAGCWISDELYANVLERDRSAQ